MPTDFTPPPIAPTDPRRLHGHEVLHLDDPGQYWLVESGQVEVFYRHGTASGTLGGRHFLFSVQAGEVLLSMADAAREHGLHLIALGLDARLVPISQTQLDAQLGRADSQAAEQVDAWVHTLSSSLGAGVRSGRVETLKPGEPLALRRGQVASVEQGVGWASVESGQALLIGDPSLPIAIDAPLPLTDALWLEAVEPDTRVSLWSTDSVLRGGIARAALARFHHLAMQRVAAQARHAAEVEDERLRRKAELDESSLHDVLGTLTNMLEDESEGSTFAGLDRDDPLFAACQIVGRAMEVPMQAPPRNRPGRQASDPVSAIAQASRIRVRQVMLRYGWWGKSNGPLLATLETDDGDRPVALIHDRPARYLLCDPTTQTTQRVTADIAAHLKPTAHMFVAPFDSDVLTPHILWRFATRGMKSEQRTILLAGLAAALMGLVVPLFSKVLFDDIIPQADRGGLLQIGFLLFVFAFAASAFTLVRGLTLLRLEARAEQQVEAALVDRMLRLPTSFFKRYAAGDLAERVLGVSMIRRILTETGFSGAIGGVFSVVNLALLFYFDVRLALIGLALGVISFVVIFVSGLYTVRYTRQVMAWTGRISGEVLQFMTGIAKLRVAGAEQRAFTQWAEKFAVQKKLAYRAGSVQNNLEIFNATYPVLTSMVFFAAVYLFAMQDLLAGAALPGGAEPLSTGSFIAVISSFSLFLAGALGLGLALISVLEVVALYERARPILEEPMEVRPDSKDPGALEGEIEVTHVTFRYSDTGPIILDGVSLRVEPGQMVALVGASGSGKSTLFRLLLGLERPQSGSIYFDGQDLASLDIDAVRRQIGTVLQSDTLRPGDLYKNIVGTSTVLTLDDAWEAARLAGFEEDVKAMPMGMHTVVSEGGSTFSGGQQQRLMIARALVHRPRLLLFDEATSALDNRTQRIVSESLAALHVTRIVIAHRLSTIRDADRIFVFEKGRVAEQGTYRSLMEQGGLFSRLASRQLADPPE